MVSQGDSIICIESSPRAFSNQHVGCRHDSFLPSLSLSEYSLMMLKETFHHWKRFITRLATGVIPCASFCVFCGHPNPASTDDQQPSPHQFREIAEGKENRKSCYLLF